MGKTSLMPVVLEFQDDKDHSDWLHQIRTFVAPVSDAWNVLFILRDPYIHVHSLWEERWQCEIPLSTFHSYSKLRAFHGFPWFSIAMSAGGYPIHSHPELPLAVPKPGITGPFFPRLTILGSGRL